MWRYVAGSVAALLLGTAAMLLWSGAAGSRSPVEKPPGAARQGLGAVDVAPPAEAGERTREARRFARYDADKSGAISREEYLASRRKAYARLDLDGDGKVSFDEYAAKTATRFTGADRDRTGSLNAAEFQSTRPPRKAARRTNCPPSLQAASGIVAPDDDS